MPRTSTRLSLAVLIASLGLAIAWSVAWTINNPTCQDQDFGSYYRAALAVRAGRTPYVVDEYGPLGVYPYAPAYAYCLIPLTYLDYLWACRCWLLVNWLATAAGFVLALRLSLPEKPEKGSGVVSDFRNSSCNENRKRLPTPFPGFPGWSVVLLTLVPMTGYLWTNLHVGQASMLMALGCLAWAYYQRQGNRFLGGTFLAAAGAVKLAPLALLPYLVHQRDRRGWAGFVTGSVLLFALPAAWVGWEGSYQLHVAWFKHTAATQVPVQIYRPGNQSLLAQLARLPPFSNGHECYSPQRLSRLTHAYPFVLAGAGALLYAWILWDRRRNRSGNPLAAFSCDPLHLALLLVFITLMNPRAWRCNFVALLFPCLMLAKQIRQREPGYRMGLIALAIALLACALPTHGLGEHGWNWGRWLLDGKHFWAGLAVGAACWWTSRGQFSSALKMAVTRLPKTLPALKSKGAFSGFAI
jgi:hypothetical protein